MYKKLISVLLAAVLLLGMTVPCFAASECSCGYDPIVMVYGFCQSNLYVQHEDGSVERIFEPSNEALMQLGGNLVLPLLRFALTHNYENLAKDISKAAATFLAPFACDKNGDSVENVITDPSTVSSYHGYGTRFVYNYDWRLDVVDVADGLHDYIESVCAATGHSKVTLCGVSLGGAVLMSYMTRYGHDRLSGVMLLCAASQGVQMVGDLYTGKFEAKAEYLYDFVRPFTGLAGMDDSLVGALDLLDAFHIFDMLLRPVVKVLNRCGDTLYDVFLKDFFGVLPSFWCFVDNTVYAEAKDFMLDENENAKLIERIDYYHNAVMPHIGDTLQAAKADGVKVAVVAGYGLQVPPVTPGERSQSDFVVDTFHGSIGATCAPIGQQLTATANSRLSPDGSVDAATCALPDNTWLVNGLMHTWIDRDFIYWFAYANGQPTVFSDPQYPQFMNFDGKLQKFYP